MVSCCGCIERQALKRPPCQEEDGPAAFPCRLKSGCKEQRRLRRARSAEQQQWRPGSTVHSGPCRAAGIQHPPQRLRHLLSAADQSEARCPRGPAHTEPSLAIVHSVVRRCWRVVKTRRVEEMGAGGNLLREASWSIKRKAEGPDALPRDAQALGRSWREWLSRYEHWLLLHKTRVQFPPPTR